MDPELLSNRRKSQARIASQGLVDCSLYDREIVAHLCQPRGEHRSQLSLIILPLVNILTGVVLAIDQFRREGLTAYSVYFLALMCWLAYSGARSGNVGFLAVKANPHRADPS